MLVLGAIVFSSCITIISSYPKGRQEKAWKESDGLVPDSFAAEAIAEIVWKTVYGKEVAIFKPYKSILLGDTVWQVCGTLPRRYMGGVPYILIQKRDGKIIKVYHTR
jgi:hypothetical protein